MRSFLRLLVYGLCSMVFCLPAHASLSDIVTAVMDKNYEDARTMAGKVLKETLDPVQKTEAQYYVVAISRRDAQDNGSRGRDKRPRLPRSTGWDEQTGGNSRHSTTACRPGSADAVAEPQEPRDPGRTHHSAAPSGESMGATTNTPDKWGARIQPGLFPRPT